MLRRQHYHRDLPDPCVHDNAARDLFTVTGYALFLLLVGGSLLMAILWLPTS